MKVLITESAYLSLISEEMGVPRNIINVAETIYRKIISYINSQRKFHQVSILGFQFDYNFTINNNKFNKAGITLDFKDNENVDNVTLYMLRVEDETYLSPNRLKKIPTKSGEIKITLGLASPSDRRVTKEEVLNFLIYNKPDMISRLSHELLHAYTNDVKPERKSDESIEYGTINSMQMGIPELDKFTFFLYYMNKAEDLTRPTEMAAHMKQKRVTKSNFLKYMKDPEHPIMPMLKIIKKFTYNDLRRKLLRNIYEINAFAIRNRLPDFQNKSSEEKIDTILKIYVSTFYKKLLDGMINFTDLFGNAGYNQERMAAIEKFMEKAVKGNNFEDFFVFYEKFFKFAAERTIRKLEKLYDMAINDSEPKKTMFSEVTNSIYDWDLYHKINKTKIGELHYSFDKKNLTKKK